MDIDAHNTLIDTDVTDPVINAIRLGMDSIMKIAYDTIPRCPEDDEELRKSVTERIEISLLQLVESELSYSQTASIVNQVVDELNLQDNPEIETKEFLVGIDSISALTNQRIAEYKRTLTQDVLRAHPTFLQMKSSIETLLEEGSLDEEDGEDDEGAETEADEVDLDQSVIEDGDQEVIPELDPISKQPLKDPVRNRICRHIYGKTAITQLIKKNPKTRCPAMGCSNTKFVKPLDLVSDAKLTAKVNKKASHASSSATSVAESRSATAQSKRAKRGRRR